MSVLKRISERVQQEINEQNIKEITEISKEILLPPELPSYPLNLFVQKFYLPFRALVEFSVDTVQLASKQKYGEPRSSLYRDWISICVLPTNKVVIEDTKNNNKIVTILPPIIKSPELRDGYSYTEGNINMSLVKSAQASERGDVKGSLFYIDQAGKEWQEKFNISREHLEHNLTDWKKCLDTIDEYMGRKTSDMVKQIKNLLPEESVKESKETTKEDLLDAFG